MESIITDILSQSAGNTEFRTKDIPNLELYMDQIIGFINGNFAPNSAEKEKLLTKTMIHNYSKEGLIKPVKGKKYSKEHIIQMILVYQLKNTLKINDIKALLTNIYAWEGYNATMLAANYDKHMDSKDKLEGDAAAFIDVMLEKENLSLDNKEDAFVLLLNMAALSACFKSLSEGLVDYICNKNDE